MYIEMQNKKKLQRNAVGDIIDKVLGDQGIKTEVSVTVPGKTIAVVVAAIFVGVTGAILAANALKKAIAK